jgi:Zn finger protein HypA/HybF involved in hydrogenase expression
MMATICPRCKKKEGKIKRGEEYKLAYCKDKCDKQVDEELKAFI